uniref:Alternative protein LOC100294360 n=1 Tax=Homo sapiens TaxID=9606 RepID=L8ECQ6_HUMAN|nr:alternative protein LOC100294360 [Homo sapiens]
MQTLMQSWDEWTMRSVTPSSGLWSARGRTRKRKMCQQKAMKSGERSGRRAHKKKQ